MEKNSGFGFGQNEEKQSEIETSPELTRAHYFSRTDDNPVSHEVLDSYAAWMISDALKIEDARAKGELLKLVQNAVSTARISENPEIGFSELFEVEIEYIAHGYLEPRELQKQIN